MKEDNPHRRSLKNSTKYRINKFLSVFGARLKSFFSKHKLPPGDLSRFDQLAPKDQRFLLKRFGKYGEIFKTVWYDKLLVCVVGLKSSKRLLTENSDKIKAINVELRHIFPKGFIRNMRGETHKKYRKHFSTALKFEIDKSNHSQLGNIISNGLSDFSKTAESSPSAKTYQDSLNTITTGLLLYVFFGVEFGSDEFKSLSKKYNRLGPDGFVWQVGDQQRQIYLEIVEEIKTQIELIEKGKSPCSTQSVLSKMTEGNSIDETVIGNLIYMVEMGRFDMYSLFRWLTKFLVDNPEMGAAISESSDPDLAKAFVLESLRMEQSEGLIREATEDFVFDGYLVPKGAALRLCLWEPHKFNDPFNDPFVFDPKRFLDKDYGIEQYAPFGLDQHRCPAGNMVVDLSSLFVSTLVRGFEMECIEDGPSFRGVYHWQPNENFAVCLQKKTLSA